MDMEDVLWVGGALLLGAIGVSIYNAASNEERESRNRWKEKRKEVELTIEEHQKRIDEHIAEARGSYDYNLLINLHYSPMMCANSAYKLLDDARDSLSGINKMLKKSKMEKKKLQKEIDSATEERSWALKRELIEKIKMVNELRRGLFDEREKLIQQKENFLHEVRRLNKQTRKLKEYIRDRCGEKGRNWYARLEERKRQHRLAERYC